MPSGLSVHALDSARDRESRPAASIGFCLLQRAANEKKLRFAEASIWRISAECIGNVVNNASADRKLSPRLVQITIVVSSGAEPSTGRLRL